MEFVKINEIQLFLLEIQWFWLDFNDFDWISMVFYDFREIHDIAEPLQVDKMFLRKFHPERFCVWCLENIFPGSLPSVSRRSRCVKLAKSEEKSKFQESAFGGALGSIFYRKSNSKFAWILMNFDEVSWFSMIFEAKSHSNTAKPSQTPRKWCQMPPRDNRMSVTPKTFEKSQKFH